MYYFSSTIYILYPIIIVLFKVFEGVDGTPLKIARVVFAYGGMLIYVCSLLLNIWGIQAKIKMQFFLYIFLAAASVAPFMIVTPFGERCIFLSYFFICVFILKGMDYVSSEIKENSERKIQTIIYIAIISLSLILVTNFIRIEKWNQERNNYIESCMLKNDKEITIFEFPTSYSFTTYLVDKYYYYEVRGDIKFKIVDYDSWKKKFN